jgi:hypothetical protein
MAVMGKAIEQRRGHLGVAEHVRPFGDAQVGGDDDAGVLRPLTGSGVVACTLPRCLVGP